MCYHWPDDRERSLPTTNGNGTAGHRVLTDGGTPEDEGTGSDSDEAHENEGTDDDPREQSNVEIREAGEAEPAEPKWEEPDLDDIPEFEVRADESVVESGGSASTRKSESDPTAGRPHDARAPGATAVSSEGSEAYLAALELCARLPDDVRLPEEAADLVPAAVEAELEEDIQNFAATEFDNPRPHVDTLAFDEIDDEIWLRIRIGVPAEGFEDVDPDEIRSYALQQLEGVL